MNVPHSFRKFYFINSLFAVGMVFGLMGLTIFLRWEYNLFGDPVGPLIFAVMFLFGDLMQKLLRRLADIKVSRQFDQNLEMITTKFGIYTPNFWYPKTFETGGLEGKPLKTKVIVAQGTSALKISILAIIWTAFYIDADQANGVAGRVDDQKHRRNSRRRHRGEACDWGGSSGEECTPGPKIPT